MDLQLSEHFNAKEFVCRCGKCIYSKPETVAKVINPEIPRILENVRHDLKVPIRINSGIRCRQHHINIYKGRYGDYWELHIVWNSNHLFDKDSGYFHAADWTCDMKLYKAAMVAANKGFKQVGWYTRENGMDIFIHSGITGEYCYYRKVYK